MIQYETLPKSRLRNGIGEQAGVFWQQVCVLATRIFHVAACVIPLGFALSMGEELLAWAKDYPWVSCFWISFVALGHPGWIWWETMEFENWVRMKPEAQRKVERAHYQLHVGLAKNFWQAVMYMYTAAGLIGAALKAATSPE